MKRYIQAARLRTLPLSISGIIVGCGLASFKNRIDLSKSIDFDVVTFFDELDFTIFILAILTTISFQILSNFANDYGDGVKGTDDNRKGEKRAIASGDIAPKQMMNAIKVMIGISLLFAATLIYLAFGKENFGYSILFLGLGIASIIAAIKYTMGKSAYGYSGLGDVFVFLFFGIVSVLGSYFLYVKQLHWDLLLPASTIGFLSAAVLNLNNMRDQIEDKKANKNTLVVKLGSQNAKKYHYILIIGALICAVAYCQIHYFHPAQYIFLIAFIPLLYNIIVVAKNILYRDLDKELKKVALSTFLFAILFVVFSI